jgi:hypothetical protein
MGTPAGVGADTELPSTLRLAPPALLCAVGRAIAAMKRSSGVDSEIDAFDPS